VNRNRIFTLIVVLVGTLALFWVQHRRSQWEAYVYADRNDVRSLRFLGRFDGLEACRDAALAALQRDNGLLHGDYFCGRDCRDGPQGARVCGEAVH